MKVRLSVGFADFTGFVCATAYYEYVTMETFAYLSFSVKKSMVMKIII